MLIDCVEIEVVSGSGGDGIVSWQRSKYQEKGGPSGGDGGKGGDILFKATENISTLFDYKYKKFFQAENGQKGGKSNRSGASGQDLVLLVPVGTKISLIREQEVQEVYDLRQVGEQVCLLRGGKGGKGNQHFSRANRQAPHFCYPGEVGVQARLKLELKLIADIGIIGFPNAGKSTLISTLSASKAKIADYPFTTLVPNLGVIKFEEQRSLVLADVPGLIENASQGAGLGVRFLKHVERTEILLHLVDISIASEEECLKQYQVVNQELANFKSSLLEKREVIVLSKIDACQTKKILSLVNFFKSKRKEVFAISAVSGAGLEELRNFLRTLAIEKENRLSKLTNKLEPDSESIHSPQKTESELEELLTSKSALFSLKINETTRIFEIESEHLRKWLKVTDFTKAESIENFYRELKKIGLIEELKAKGIQNGETVMINKHEMVWSNFSTQGLI